MHLVRCNISCVTTCHVLRNITRTMYTNPYIQRYKQKPLPPTCHKETTGLTGVFVDEHPHHSLKKLYGRILNVLEQMPETAAYRKYTEATIKKRYALVQEESDIRRLEDKIGMGQIEEVVLQAKHELVAAQHILKYKAWEPLVEKAPVGQWDWPVV